MLRSHGLRTSANVSRWFITGGSERLLLAACLLAVSLPAPVFIHAQAPTRNEMVRGGASNLVSWMEAGTHWIYSDNSPTSYRSIAVTAIAAEALAVALAKVDLEDDEAATRTAITNATQFLTDYYLDPITPSDCSDTGGLPHYALQYLVRLKELGLVPILELNPATIDAAVAKLIGILESCFGASHQGMSAPAYCELLCCDCDECDPGVQTCPPGDCNQTTFETAPALIALYLAQENGYAVNGASVQNALDALLAARVPGEIVGNGPFNLPGPHAGAFTYADRNLVWPRSYECERATVAGSGARTSVAEAALHIWGRTPTPARLERAVDVLFNGRAEDAQGAEQDIYDLLKTAKDELRFHHAPYGIATYYFFFGLYGAGVAIEHVSNPTERANLRSLMLTRIDAARGCFEPATGFCWNDQMSHASDPRYGRNHGTAAAVLTLLAEDVFPVGTANTVDFRRGDADLSGVLDVTDPITILNWAFSGIGTLWCLDAADADDSGTIEVTDGAFLFNFLFYGGPAPPPPPIVGTEPGPDPTPDALSCVRYPQE